MISSITGPSFVERDTLLVIAGNSNGGAPLLETLRRSYPAWAVHSCDSYLSAIADLSQRPAQVIVAYLDTHAIKPQDAVAGLREAAGGEAKLVLVCRPDQEPLARTALRGGADDYVIHPIVEKELDAALGYVRGRAASSAVSSNAATISIEELSRFAELMKEIDVNPTVLLSRIGDCVRRAFNAKGATIVVEGAVGVAGEAVTKAVLAAPLTGCGGVMGQLLLAEAQDAAYSPAHAEKLKHYAVIVSDLLHAAADRRRLHELAVTDDCSGLPNRRYLFEAMDEILARAEHERFPVTFLLFDVDNFKEYNDRFGHTAGDEIIRACGELFHKQCRDQDVLARFGGDEFGVVFWDPDGRRVPGSEHPSCALAVFDRVRDSLKAHQFAHPLLKPQIALTISGGLATYPWDGRTREELIARADEALLAAKRGQKSRVCRW